MQTEAVVLAVVDSLSAAGRRDAPHVSNLARSAYKFSNLTKASVPAALQAAPDFSGEIFSGDLRFMSGSKGKE